MDGSVKVRVLLVDDHTLVAESMRRALEGEHDLDVVGIAATLAEAVVLARRTRPDVVVLDHHLPDAVGAAAIQAMRRVVPDAPVVSCTAHGSEEMRTAAHLAGAAGHVDKVDPLRVLVDAIRAVHAGGTFRGPAPGALDAAVGREPAPPTSGAVATPSPLSRREHEVLVLIGDGVSTRDIASRLEISPHTVRKHVQTILGKLGAHSKLEGVARARRLGYLDDAGAER